MAETVEQRHEPTKHGEMTLYCDFCGKSQHEVGRLIAGTANICDDCVDLSREIIAEERKALEGHRGVPCPCCNERISLIAAIGRDQRWGIAIKPGPTGLLNAATVAGTIDGAQKMMRASCREDGATVQTYVESIRTLDDGTLEIDFATLATSKRWAEANGRANTPSDQAEGL